MNYPNYSCSQIENNLISSAEDLGPRGYDDYNDLFKVYKKGYMSGKRENNFMPMDNMKRQDVAKGDYFANAAVWAYDNGIVTGYSNGKFGRW